jgi:hypothetical protein
LASFDVLSFDATSFFTSSFDLDAASSAGVSPPGRRGVRRWVVKKNGESYFFDDPNEIEAFLKEEPGERTVIREEGKKTVVLKSKHKLPDVEKVVNEWNLEVPQITLPTIGYLSKFNDANFVPKRDTDEEDFMEFLAIL